MSNLMSNPYKVGPPVTGIDFYGRAELLSKVQKALQTSNVVLLQGQRRIGKTSFLKQLSVFLKSPQGEQAFPVPLVPVIFDIQRYVQDTLPQFQGHLAEAIARELQLTVPSLPEWEANRVLFQDVWLPQVYERLGNRGLVILVDEFDNLEGQTAPQAMQKLIPFLGQLVSGETRLKWVLTLGRQAGKLPIQYDPVVSTGQHFRMSFLSSQETREVIEKPAAGLLTYQPKAIGRIYQLTSGQPHLTQALGSEIFQWVMLEQEREAVEAEDVDAVLHRTLETYDGAIASIVRLSPLEERVLTAVAQLTGNGKTTSRDEIINLLLNNSVQLSRDDLTSTLRNLMEWELLLGDVNFQTVKVTVELVRIWLIKNLAVEPSQKEKIDINATLAQKRFESAEEFREGGHYEQAILDYREALQYNSQHLEALRGLAETYRLNKNLIGRIDILEQLYKYDTRILNELVETLEELAKSYQQNNNLADRVVVLKKIFSLDNRKGKITLIAALENYAKQAESENNYFLASKQYVELIQLQNDEKWRHKCVDVIAQSFAAQLEKMEKKLASIPPTLLKPVLNLNQNKSVYTNEINELNHERKNLIFLIEYIEKKVTVVLDNSIEAKALKWFLESKRYKYILILRRFQDNEKIIQKQEKSGSRNPSTSSEDYFSRFLGKQEEDEILKFIIMMEKADLQLYPLEKQLLDRASFRLFTKVILKLLSLPFRLLINLISVIWDSISSGGYINRFIYFLVFFSLSIGVIMLILKLLGR